MFNVNFYQFEERFCVENSEISCSINKDGTISSLKLKMNQSEVVKSAGNPFNEMVIFDDVPLYWDAWDVMDYHTETRLKIYFTSIYLFEVSNIF